MRRHLASLPSRLITSSWINVLFSSRWVFLLPAIGLAMMLVNEQIGIDYARIACAPIAAYLLVLNTLIILKDRRYYKLLAKHEGRPFIGSKEISSHIQKLGDSTATMGAVISFSFALAVGNAPVGFYWASLIFGAAMIRLISGLQPIWMFISARMEALEKEMESTP